MLPHFELINCFKLFIPSNDLLYFLGDHLLYLLEQPEISGNISCEYVEEANVEKLIVS